MATSSASPSWEPEPAAAHAPRSCLRVTLSVWHAMFMREALARTMADRFSWFWMLAEPIAVVAIMVGVREVAGAGQHVGGADHVQWLVAGLMGFYLFRDGMVRSLGAVDANKGLFAYRQVKPVDPVLVRNALEGVLQTMVLLLLTGAVGLLGHEAYPFDPLSSMLAWASLWFLGLGAGLVTSVGATLIPEIGTIVRLSGLPLLLASGPLVPVQAVPHLAQQYLLWNPILHGIESLRLGFFVGYTTASNIDLLYLWYWALTMIALGLALHVRFAARLIAT